MQAGAICCLAAALALSVAAAQSTPSPTETPAKASTDAAAPVGQAPAAEAPAEEAAPAVPITPPSQVDVRLRPRLGPQIAESTTIFDRVCMLEKSAQGRWWAIQDPTVGWMYLLPCQMLETVEKVLAESPGSSFRLSGEVFQYRGFHYLLLRRAMLERPGGEVAAAAPAAATDTTATAPATQPAKVTADDVGNALLSEVPAKPVVPPRAPTQRTQAPSVVLPAGSPLKAGPGRMVVNRLTRLSPLDQSSWFTMTFESDNTLREPPMRVLPGRCLQDLESRSKEGTADGAIYHVSGEIHHYRGEEYLLVRSAIPKRNMGQF